MKPFLSAIIGAAIGAAAVGIVTIIVPILLAQGLGWLITPAIFFGLILAVIAFWFTTRLERDECDCHKVRSYRARRKYARGGEYATWDDIPSWKDKP